MLSAPSLPCVSIPDTDWKQAPFESDSLSPGQEITAVNPVVSILWCGLGLTIKRS